MVQVRKGPSGPFDASATVGVPTYLQGPAAQQVVPDAGQQNVSDLEVDFTGVDADSVVNYDFSVSAGELSAGTVVVSVVRNFSPDSGSDTSTVLVTRTIAVADTNHDFRFTGVDDTIAEAGDASYVLQIEPTGGTYTIETLGASAAVSLY